MRNEREEILAGIREAIREKPNKEKRPFIDPLSIVPARRLEGDDLWAAFARNFANVRGYYYSSIADLSEFLRSQNARVGYCDPDLRESVGEPLSAHLDVRYEYTREAIDDLVFGITIGSAVIAESGTIILRESETSNRLAALAPWIHIAVVRTEQIHRSMEDALADLGNDPNTIWVTGPSKTADVEGILIEGVHGPGEQVCLRL